jgi:hypothetical protein
LSERRDWAALPRDVLWVILSLVPQDDILRTAGLVCASWRRLAVDEPLLWQRIDLPAEEDEDGHPPSGWKARACAAVRRSAGRCESYRGRVNPGFLLFLARRYARNHGSLSQDLTISLTYTSPQSTYHDDQILISIAFLTRTIPCWLLCSAPLLRSLHVTSRFDMPSEKFMTVLAKTLPLLEQLVMSRGHLGDGASLVALVDHCPRLRLLDAAGCSANHWISDTLLARLESRIKDLRLPEPKLGFIHRGWMGMGLRVIRTTRNGLIARDLRSVRQ